MDPADRHEEKPRARGPGGDGEPGAPAAGQAPSEGSAPPARRRTFLASASSAALATGLVGAYGSLGAVAVRYLYPATEKRTAWAYVTEVLALAKGASMPYQTPSGEKVTVARVGDGATESDFIALSSTCPHLGCQVHWEAQNARFFCPCHNGAFDAVGRPLSGPPAEAKQPLVRYPLKVEGALLFMQVATETLPSAEGSG